MTVAFDAATFSSQNGSSPYTFSHTPVGTPAGVVVTIVMVVDAGSVTAVTYGGVAMSQILNKASGGGESGRAFVYFLGASVPTGTQTVSITHNGSGNATQMSATTVTDTGDTQIGDSQFVTATQQNASVSLSTTGTSLRVGAIYTALDGLGGLAALTGMTLIGQFSSGFRSTMTHRQTTPSSGAFTFGYTTNISTDISLVAVAVESAPAAIVTPATIAAVAALPTPTIALASAVSPATIAAVAALPTPTILAGAAANVTPATIAATVTLPTPLASGTPTALISVADEGLRFEAWSMPHVGALTRKFDFTKLIESWTLNDRFNDLTDGTMTIPDDASLAAGVLLKDRLFHIDEANHANDVGSMVRVLRGTTPIMHYLITRFEDSFSDGEPTCKFALEGLEWILDRVLVPNFDHPADPTVDPDWIYGADSILKNTGLEESGQSMEIQLLWLTGASGGTFTITYSGQTTAAINWNADWFAVGNALEALSNIQDVTVSGAGTGASPWTVEFIDPSGNVAQMTMNIGSLTGPAPLQHIETTLPGGQNDTSGWTTSFNPETGEPHGTYTVFQIATSPVHSGTYSLEVNAEAPANPSDFPGAQQILNVTPGRTYRASVWVYPTFSATFRLVIRTTDETFIAQSAGAGTPLTANVWNEIVVDPFVVPSWIDQIIFRVGLISSADLGSWYIDDALLAPGFPPATLGTMMSDIRTAAIAVGSPLSWLTPTWTTTTDSDGNAWDATRQWNVNHGQSFLQLFEYARKWNYEFRLRWDNVDLRFEWDMWNPNGGGQTRAGIAVSGKSGVEGSAPIVKRPPGATYVKAEGALGRWGEFASTTLDDVWGRLEKFHQDRQGVNSDELDVLAERIVTKTEANTAARQVTVADPVLLPWTAYEPGDIVTLNLSPKDVKKDLRIAAIVASKGPQDAVPRYDVHFGAVVYSNDTAIASGLRTLIREFKRPIYNPPVGATLPDIPPPQSAGYGAPTLVIAASNASDISKLKADYLCTGTDDQIIFRTALARLSAAEGGRLLLTEGDFNFSATVLLTTPSPITRGLRIEGVGIDATQINMSNGANANMFTFNAGTVELSNFTMDGNSANQTGGGAGVYLGADTNGTFLMHHVAVGDMKGTGIFSDRSACTVTITDSIIELNTSYGMDLSVEGRFNIANNHIQTNGSHGVRADGAHINLIGNKIYSNTGRGFSAGGIFQGSGQIVVGNDVQGNGGTGIYLEGHDSIISGNFCDSNGVHGIESHGVDGPNTVTGNVCISNTEYGIYLRGGHGGSCTGNTVRLNGQHGIVVEQPWLVEGNKVMNNSRTTTNTYDGIRITGNNVAVLTNMVRQTTGAPVQKYGINIVAGATNTWVAGNDARGGGFGTAAYVDAGTTSVKVWVGAFGDNQP